jgi:hypothetical protein
MFSTPSHGESPGLRRVREGTFFDFFLGSVRAPNRFPAMANRGGEEGVPGGGDRELGSRWHAMRSVMQWG